MTATKFDALEVHETKLVTTRHLRPGVLLCDELGCAVAQIDHRISTRNGNARYLVRDLEGHSGWYEVGFHVTTTPRIRVAT